MNTFDKVTAHWVTQSLSALGALWLAVGQYRILDWPEAALWSVLVFTFAHGAFWNARGYYEHTYYIPKDAEVLCFCDDEEETVSA